MSRHNRFDDSDTIDAQAQQTKEELARLKSDIADALEECVDADALRKALNALTNARDFDDPEQERQEMEVGKMREALSKFSESDFKHTSRQNVLNAFKAELRARPGEVSAADWLQSVDSRCGRGK